MRQRAGGSITTAGSGRSQTMYAATTTITNKATASSATTTQLPTSTTSSGNAADDADIAAGARDLLMMPDVGSQQTPLHPQYGGIQQAQQPGMGLTPAEKEELFIKSYKDNHDRAFEFDTNKTQQRHYPVGGHGGGGSTPMMLSTIESAPTSLASTFSIATTDAAGQLEFFEDLVSEPVLVLGMDITHLSRSVQFMVCATGVFFFSLLYGYLQELISVQLCNRRLGLFLAQVQFSGYTLLAYVLRSFVYEREKKQRKENRNIPVPLLLYLGLSLLRAVDLGMTNLAMQYINYPAKTLMKSSRVVFTMLFGVLISRKKYKFTDYAIVFAMVAGLAIFMHADANSSAVFHYMGVIMLTISLVCDGAISNMSESIMSQFGVGQDEFIFRMYSIALVAITMAAAYKGDMTEGMAWLSQPGTYDELALPISERTWSVPGKVACLVLFSSMGFFGSSCAAAITKQFGALTMSITSTARKATTLFLSFLLFNNVCTMEHVSGMVIFISALTVKSLRRRHDKHHRHGHKHRKQKQRQHKMRDDDEERLPLTIELGLPSSPNDPSEGASSRGSKSGLHIRRSGSRDGSSRLNSSSFDSGEQRTPILDNTKQRHHVHIV